MSTFMNSMSTLPPVGGTRWIVGPRPIMPKMKEPATARTVDKFKTNKVRASDVQILLQFLRECFGLAPTTTPADTICKIRYKMAAKDNKIKQLKQQLLDHDVLLMEVLEAVNLGPEVGPVRATRALKKHLRTSRDLTSRLQETNKTNEALVQASREIAGVSGHHASEGLANYFRSTWNKQKHQISKLKNTIQELKENGRSQSVCVSQNSSNNKLMASALAKSMENTDTHNQQSLVKTMKARYIAIADDICTDLVKEQTKEIAKELRDRKKTQAKGVVPDVELQKEVQDLKTKNRDLALDLKEANDLRRTADDMTFDLKRKVHDLEMAMKNQACELEDMLQRYEEAGELVSSLQSDLEESKGQNQTLGEHIKNHRVTQSDESPDQSSALEKRVASLLQEKRRLEEQVKIMNEEGVRGEECILQISEELADLQQKNQDLHKELKAIQSMANKPDIAGDQTSLLSKQREHYKQQIKSLHDKAAEREKLIKRLEFQSSTLSKTHHRTESSSSNLMLTLEGRVADLQREKEALEKRLESKTSSFPQPQTHQRTESSSSNLVLTLEGRVADLQREKEALEKRLESKTSSFLQPPTHQRTESSSSNLVLTLEGRVADLQREKEALEKRLESKTSSFLQPKTHQRTESSSSNLVLTLEGRVADLQRENQRLQDELKIKTVKGPSIANPEQTPGKALVKWQKQRKDLESLVKDLLNQQELTADSGNNKEDLSQKLEETQKDRDSLVKRYESETLNLKTEIAKLTSRLKEKNGDVEKNTSSSKQLKELKQLRRRKDELKSQVKILTEEKEHIIADHQEDIAQRVKANEELAKTLQELVDHRTRMAVMVNESLAGSANLKNANEELIREKEALQKERDHVVSQHTAEVADLQTKLNVASSHIAKLTSTLKNLRKRLEDGQKVAEAGSSQLKEELESRISQLEKERNLQSSRHVEQIKRLSAARNELKSQLQKERNERLSRHFEKINKLGAVRDDFQAQLKISLDKLKTEVVTKNGLQTTVANLTKEKEDLSSEIEKAQGMKQITLDRLKTEVVRSNGFQTSIANLTKEKEDMNSELEQAQGMNQITVEKLKTELARSNDLQTHVANLTKEKEDLSSQLKQIQVIKQITMDKLKSELAKSNDFQTDIANLTKEKEDLSSKLEQSQGMQQITLDKLKTEVNKSNDLQATIANLTKEKEDMSSEIEQADNMKQAFQDKFQASIATEEKQRSKIEDLGKQITQLSLDAENNRRMAQEWQEKFEVSSKREAELTTTISKLEKQKASLLSEIEIDHQRVKKVEVKIANITKQELKARNNVANLKMDKDALNKELGDYRLEYQKLETKMATVGDENSKLHQQVRALNTEMDQIASELDITRKQCQELEAESLQRSELEAKEYIFTDEKDKLIQKIEESLKSYQVLEEKMEETERQNKELCEKVSLLTKENQDLIQELEESRTKYQELEEKRDAAMEKFQEAETLQADTNKLNKKLQFEMKLVKSKVTSALLLSDDFKEDITNLRVEKRGLQNQLDLRKRKIEELEDKVSSLKEQAKLLETKLAGSETKDTDGKDELQELQTKLYLMKELVGILRIKAADSEAKERESLQELQAMKASLTAAAVKLGLLTSVGETVNVMSICQSFGEMKQRCDNMQVEVEELKKTNDEFQEQMKKTDHNANHGTSGDEISVREKQDTEMMEKLDDLRFKTHKQASMIRKLRYHISLFHKKVLCDRDSMFNDMSLYERAVMEKLDHTKEIDIIQAEDLLAWKDVDNSMIGQGSYGKVFLKRYQGETVAVKIPYTAEDSRGDTEEIRAKRIKANHARTTMEALVQLTFADHESFPRLYGIAQVESAPSLVLEFLGDKKTGISHPLSHTIKFQTLSLSRREWINIIMDIVSGLKAMHEKGLLHNDLKANNVLLQWNEKEKRWRAFLIDFGKVSTLLMPLKHRNIPDDEMDGYRKGVLFQHLAPEYILDLEPTSVQSDIYSLGKVVGRIEKLIKSHTLKDLVAAMTNVKPRLRPSWRNIENAIHKAMRKSPS